MTAHEGRKSRCLVSRDLSLCSALTPPRSQPVHHADDDREQHLSTTMASASPIGANSDTCHLPLCVACCFYYGRNLLIPLRAGAIVIVPASGDSIAS